MKSIRLHHVLFGAVLLAVLLCGGCGGGGGGSDGPIAPGVTPMVLHITWSPADRQESGARWARILVQDLQQNDLIPPETILLQGDPTTTVTLEVPNGEQRVITVEARDRDNVLLDRGTRAVDVGPDRPNQVAIDVGPVPDRLVVTPNPVDLFVDSSPVATSVAATAGGNAITPGSIGYVSSDAAVATVDQNGVVSPRAVGNATVTAISGTVTGATAVHVLDFRLALSPDPAALAPGTSRDVTVTATRQGGDFPITLNTVNNLPTGVTANTPVTIPAGETTANVTLTAAANAATGQVQINATGTATAGSRTATRTSPNLTLNVRDFTLSVQPDPARLPVDGRVDLTVTLLRQRSRAQGPDFDVTLTDVIGLPNGITVSPDTSLPITLPAGSNEATITLETDRGATPGTAQITVIGEISINGETAQRTSAAVTLEVFNFSLALSPDPAALAPGTSRDVTVTAVRQGSDFPVTINTVNNLPAGVSANTPVTIPAGETTAAITLTAAANATIGQVQIHVEGTASVDGQTVTRTSPNLTLNVRDFTLSVQPDPARLAVGSTVDLTVALLRQRSRAQGPDFDVTLTDVTGLPSGVTVSPETPLPITVPVGSDEATITLEAAPNATTGAAQVTVTGEISINGETARRTSAAVTLEVFDFRLALSPSPAYLGRGDTADVTVSLTRQWSRSRQSSDFDVTITAVNGLPSQVSALNLPLTIPAGQSSGVIQLQATSQASLGSSTITATGQADGAQRTSAGATLSLFDFALAFGRPNYTLFLPLAGQTEEYVVEIGLERGGFDTEVEITALNNLPAGVTALNLPLNIAPGATVASVVLSVSDQARVGQSTIAATGTATPDGVNTAARTSPNATLVLVDYTLAASPDPLTIIEGYTAGLTLDLVRINWNGALRIEELRNLPVGVSVTPSVPTALSAGQTSLTLTFGADPLAVDPGDYTIMILVAAEVTPGYAATRIYTLQIQVIPPTTAFGTVVDGDTQNAVEGVTVTLDTGQTAITDKGGDFLFNQPPVGPHTLTFTQANFGDRAKPGNDVQVQDFNIQESQDNDVGTVSIWPTRIIGVVVDAVSGLGIPAQISLDGAAPVDTDAQGGFGFGPVTPNTTHLLTASKDNYASLTVRVTPKKGEELNAGNLPINPTRIRVEVTDSFDQGPYQGVTVRLLKADGSVEDTQVTDSQGVVVFGPTAPGDRTIQLQEGSFLETTVVLRNVTLGRTNNYTVTYPY